MYVRTGCNLMITVEKLHCPRSRPFNWVLIWELLRGDGNVASSQYKNERSQQPVQKCSYV